MTDTALSHDDAPLTTSKDSDVLQRAAQEVGGSKGDSVSGRTATINRPRSELFAFWRDFSNLSQFMDGVTEVVVIDNARSQWRMRASGGDTVDCEMMVTNEAQDEYIAWASGDGADVNSSGRVDFRDATGGRGTAVTVTMAYDPPGGFIGKLIATMFQSEPGLIARRDLRRFKQLMETGEIAVAAWTNAQADSNKE